ncbi:MAG TPA: serine hydrolase domain-containing protein [Chryseosolibacter sp.]|nr:serine hydrolase domain-containing protein [Chryseosolibacter sp.]
MPEIRKFVTTISLLFLWIILITAIFVIEQKYRHPDVTPGDFHSLEQYLEAQFNQAYKTKNLGCGGFAVIDRGKIRLERGFGIANHINARVDVDSTLFLLSSLSKAVTAWGVIKLVEEQCIKSLDEPIFRYLQRWSFPGKDTLAKYITSRHLLSHTAGFVDGYGHSGVESENDLQSIEESLSGPNDANQGASHPATAVFRPGTEMSYSSAGYGVLQLLIEEKTGKPFHAYMRDNVLLPLGMRQSTYRLEDVVRENRSAHLAAQYDLEMKPHPHRYYANMAGVSLRASIHDLALFAAAYSSNAILSQKSIEEFYTPQPGTSMTWGLGHTLYMENSENKFVFGHGGGAFPASGSEMRINPTTGNAIVLVATGSQNFISPLADDWLYWETGKSTFDIRNVIRRRGLAGALIMLGGCIGIVLWQIKRKNRKGK